MQQKQQKSKQKICRTYFDLIQKIGSNGRYQKTLLILFIWSLYSCGVGQLGPTFFFIIQPFQCQKYGLITQNCVEYICSLPQQYHYRYLDNEFTSYTIPVQYKYYQCSNTINILYGFIYFGFIISIFIRSFIVDSYGRRPLFILFNGLILVGSILSISSINIWLCCIGLFSINCGVDGITKMTFNYLSQYYQSKIRQKYSVLIQIFYTIGYLLICWSSYLIQDWRITAGIFICLPSIFGLLFCWKYMRQIPRYLHKKGRKQLIKTLNQIAIINNKQLITNQDIQNIQFHKKIQNKQKINPLILCKYPSIRKISICYFIIIFLILTLYYGSSILIDTFSLNPYIIGTILAIADFTVYYPAYKFINKIKRKDISLGLCLIIGSTSMGLIFIEKKQDCNYCIVAIMEVILLYIFRFSTNFLYMLVLIYSNQLFPEKVRASSSFLEIFGGFSLVINPSLLGLLQMNGINPMIYFTIGSVVAFGTFQFLPETNGKVKEEIDEIEQKMRVGSQQTMRTQQSNLYLNHQSDIQQ